MTRKAKLLAGAAVVPNTTPEREHDHAPPVAPLYAGVGWAVDYTHLGRSLIYEELAKGKLRAVKIGRRTLIEVASIHEYFANAHPYRAA